MKYSIVADKFIEGATAHLKTLTPGATLVLVREPENPHDKNAVAIYAGVQKVGYVPKKQNAALAEFIRQSERNLPLTGPLPLLASDAAPSNDDVKVVLGINAKFALSPNSAFPQVEI